ncbi:carboxypeptidase regulatory-like domain-containing protein [Scytonema sp. UIC 10036]|uniref:carboxypeptidase-like regulatory domain-containing protein n=1 Tax=Scytonema sp. UIC 10036 TaxID=2304196 RepID=UPI0012DAA33C|nr:carboxypeptidase-like regulatory domain-containing protein [Scytonema sp. UIC 10036]MUG95077.1 carboxypeptidase regulatory-like domain-containing protein [Scytonema sp. UIC 10036]
MLKAPLKIFYFLNLIPLISISDSFFKSSLTLAEIAPSSQLINTILTQENTQAEKKQTTQKPAISPPKNTQLEPVLTPSHETKLDPNNLTDSTTFIIGLNVGERNLNPGVLVRGKVTDTEAVDFENWLIPYEAVLGTLKFTSKVISDREVELRSPFKIVRFNLNQIRNDPELGLVLSIKEIKALFGIQAKFDSREYAIVFDVPEVQNSASNERERQPVILKGLPKISAPNLTLSQVEEHINLSGTEGSDLTNQGTLSAVGTILGSSWFVQVDQADLKERQTWQLSELQVLRQTDKSDYYLGSQPTFWRSQSGNDFWGFTTIQRQGFSPFPNYGIGGANPTQRLQPERITATVTGRAEPGTLVRLVPNIYSKKVIAEQLVNASGIYRFDNVPVGRQIGTNYQVLLYPRGLLTAQPLVENARFKILPEQLPVGTSALVISGGWQRRLKKNDFLGKFTQFNAGVVQRWGLAQDLTVGVGGVYNSSFNALGEIFYQPSGSPFRAVVSGLVGNDMDVNIDLIWNDYPNFYAGVSSNLNSIHYNLDWGISPQFRFVSNGSFDQGANFNIQYSASGSKSSTLATLGVNTDGRFSWSLNQSLGKFYFSHQGNHTSTSSQLSYLLNPSQSLFLNYQTLNSSQNANLLTAYWSYRSPTRNRYGENLWQTELGYRIGSEGSGIYATAGTTIVPGILLQARYEGVSLTSERSSFSLQLVPSLNFQQGISPGDRQLERLHTEGGLLVRPFYDRNSNGKRDRNEEIYTDNPEFLIINNQVVKPGELDIKKDRFLLRLPPGTYRVELEPAGFPPDFQPSVNAFAVEVVAGSYTPIIIPLQPSYTVGGVVTDAEGKPLAGARVEAISTKSKSSVISITNSAGVYYLEQLRQGTYELKVNGKSVDFNTITINAQSETLQELNLKLP